MRLEPSQGETPAPAARRVVPQKAAKAEVPTETPAPAARRVVPFRMTKRRNLALSSLLDQATAREERAAQLAAHYSHEAAKHRSIRRALEALIP